MFYKSPLAASLSLLLVGLCDRIATLKSPVPSCNARNVDYHFESRFLMICRYFIVAFLVLL